MKIKEKMREYFQLWAFRLKFTWTSSQHFSTLINASTYFLFQTKNINRSPWPSAAFHRLAGNNRARTAAGTDIPWQGLSACISHNKPPPITQGPLLGSSCCVKAASFLSPLVANKRNYKPVTGRTTLRKGFCNGDFVFWNFSSESSSHKSQAQKGSFSKSERQA